jgi:6-phosphogluconolactonase
MRPQENGMDDPTPRVTIERDAQAVIEAAAARIEALSRDAIARRGRFSWALSGGNTPRRLYARLAREPLLSRIDWTRVHFFWGDERCVPPEHEDSNYRSAREALFEVIRPGADRVHRMRGEDDPAAAAAAYQALLQSFFGRGPADPPPSFDLILLGMGEDGHTASLFPGTPALEETLRWVVPNRAPNGSTRLTLTLPILNAGAHVLFLVAGEKKAKRAKQVLEDPSARLPAQAIRPRSGRLEWLLDAPAAALLTR